MSFIYFVKDYNTVDNFVNIKAMIDCIIKKKKLFTAAACFEQQTSSSFLAEISYIYESGSLAFGKSLGLSTNNVSM